MSDRIGIRLVFRLLGVLISVLPVTLCILFYFPFWTQKGAGCVLSGGVALLLVLAGLPLVRALRRLIRSPSVPLIWALLFVLFFSLSRIAHEMTVICFYGLIGNLIGAVFFRLGASVGHEHT